MRRIIRTALSLAIVIVALLASMQMSAATTTLSRPALDSIKIATTDPSSKYNYEDLLKKFMANDTTMTDEQFQYFYYGTMFREDYDPYRETYRPKQLDALKPIYLKEHQSRPESMAVLDYALAAIADNPVNIQQLVHRIHAYENLGKYDLAKIWQYKLNHLLLVIASSGSGTDGQNARIVVFPEHEYDFLNLAGYTATGNHFEEPYYDVITATPRNQSTTTDYYFDISEMLRQYYLKHPTEL